MSESAGLRVEKDEGVAILTLDRPDARNALSIALQGALIDALRDADTDVEIGAIILTGNGKAFCAGFDLKELAGGRGGGEGSGRENELAEAMAHCSKPIIGAINGTAATGGFELALACDVLIASSEARFADTHARVGMLPGWGLSQKLPRLIGIHRAKELSLTGNFLSAEQAERWGLVNRVVPAEELLPACRQLAADMNSCVPEAMRGCKRLIDEGFERDLGEAMRHENDVAVAWAERVSGGEIGARRQGVVERGRSQSRERNE